MHPAHFRPASGRKATAAALAHGRWPAILMAAGIAEDYFDTRHGPCPFCGGKDRYRWSERHGGAWLCNHCTANSGGTAWADGFTMLMKHLGLGFREAVDHVLRFVGGAGEFHRDRPQPGIRSARHPPIDRERSMCRMRAIWNAAAPVTTGDPVHRYLQARVPGLNLPLQHLRFHPALDYWSPPAQAQGSPVLLGTFPAMVAQAFDSAGNLVQIHKTYLTHDGRKADVPVPKKMDRGIGAKAFAVPLLALQGDTLGFAEGIESALAAAMWRCIPVWSCLSGPSMAAFGLPPAVMDRVARVVIFADHDPPKRVPGPVPRHRSAGSHYAEQLAQRIRAHGKRVLVLKAAHPGWDMADHWLAAHTRGQGEHA